MRLHDFRIDNNCLDKAWFDEWFIQCCIILHYITTLYMYNTNICIYAVCVCTYQNVMLDGLFIQCLSFMFACTPRLNEVDLIRKYLHFSNDKLLSVVCYEF